MLRSWRRIKNYVRYDLREIVWPSSLEHRPGEGPPEETWGDIRKAFKDGTRDYLDTWKSSPPQEASKEEDAEPPIAEELVGAAKTGAEAVKPILQRLYRTRAEAYRQAINSFVEGYKEGFAGLPDSTEETEETEDKQSQAGSETKDAADSTNEMQAQAESAVGSELSTSPSDAGEKKNRRVAADSAGKEQAQAESASGPAPISSPSGAAEKHTMGAAADSAEAKQAQGTEEASQPPVALLSIAMKEQHAGKETASRSGAEGQTNASDHK